MAAFASIPANCSAQLQAYLQCVGQTVQAPSCMAGNICPDQANALNLCVNPSGSGGGGVGGSSGGCSTDGCAGDPNSCACKGTCQGQPVAVSCQTKNNLTNCTCYFGNGQETTCTEPSPTCDLVSSCCGVYFGKGL